MRFLCCVFLLLTVSCERKATHRIVRTAPMDPPAYWVWHRSSPLTSEEISQLQTAGTKSLYWQAVECGWKDQQWQPVRIAGPTPQLPGLHVVPVFRIKPDAAFLQSPAAAPQFARMIQLWANEKGIPEIQIDFDCPDRLLARYAEFLTNLGTAIAPTKISITALASWPRHSQFKKLASSVSSMAPMFYDLHADKASDVKSSRFHPIANEADVEFIRLWSDCPVPWLAGLPNFERLSLFKADGSLSGHIRGWNHDEVFFYRELVPESLGKGITSYRIDPPTSVAGSPLPEGSRLIHRAPEFPALISMGRAAEEAGARGIIYFALPGPGIQTTFSSSHLANPASSPELAIQLTPQGEIELTNSGFIDLPARPCAPGDPTSPGWQLELTADSGAFTSGSPGQFARVTTPAGLPPEVSQTIILHFAKLPSGQTLRSMPLVSSSTKLRWTLHPHKKNESVKSP